jgi:hypothetical protein
MHVENLILNINEISDEEKKIVFKHINECESCRKFYEIVIAFENSIKSLSIIKAPSEIDIILKKRIMMDKMRTQILILFLISITFVISLKIALSFIEKSNFIIILKLYSFLSSLKLPKINDYQIIAFILSIIVSSLISEFIIIRNLKLQRGG